MGGYVAAIFHMVTHAFFKALLFLGAGSVIHGLHEEQDMRRMGGVARWMPITAITFIVGWLAIAGVPPFSGFWSKDEILLLAWNKPGVGGKALWLVGIVTALLTAFYMTRQVILTFLGRTRFYDVTDTEIDQAFEARLAAARADIDAATEAHTKALEGVEKAEADVLKRTDALTKAQETAAEARQSLAASTPDDEKQHDKLVKAHDKATKAVPKAETTLAKAQTKVGEANEDVAKAKMDLESAVARLNELQGWPPDRPAEVVTARTPATDIGELAEYLPESFAKRKEYVPHESPWTMTLPLAVLAFFAATAGLLNLPFTKDLHFLEHWLEPSLFGHEAEVTVSGATKWLLAVVAIVCAVGAVVAAFRVYLRGRQAPTALEREELRQAWYVDQTYAGFMGGPGRRLFDLLAWFDRTVVDGGVKGTAAALLAAGQGLRVSQPGFVRSYALGIAVGASFVMVWFLGRLWT